MWHKEEYGSGYWFVMWHPSSAPYAVVADKGVLRLKVLHPLDIPALDKKLKKVSGPGDFRLADSGDKRAVVKKAFIAWTAKAHN